MDEKKSIKLDFWKCIEYLRPKAAAVICLTVLLALGGFLTARFLIPPTYRAELLLYASNSGGPGAAEPATLTASDLAASKSLVDTCAALLDSRTLYEEVPGFQARTAAISRGTEGSPPPPWRARRCFESM